MKQCLMFYHLLDPIIYASGPRECYFLMEHSVMKQYFMFYVLPFSEPNSLCLQTKVILSFDDAFCHETRPRPI